MEFCGGCGCALRPYEPGATPPGPLSLTPSAERRQLTVLFCDLVGSTELSARLDPEELREIVRAYQTVSGDAIRLFDGYVAQYLGDGLLVYFGYPSAHEDDAQRAVRAALGIITAVEELRESRSVDLAVRIGIHTGPVVVGEMGDGVRQEQLALGETPNVAARLQTLAESGSVLISGTTRKLVQRAFDCRDLGLHPIKGIAAPVPVYRVLGDIGGAQHAAAPFPRGLLVGRDSQMALVLDRWDSAVRGSGQVVLIIGEPGIGKSRLLETVRERASAVPHIRLEASCSPYHQTSPFYPITSLIAAAARIRLDDSAEARIQRLEECVAELAMPPTEALPLLMSLLSLPTERHPMPVGTPQRIKQKTIGTVLGMFRAIAVRQPLLLLVEDLHWVDASTLELLTQLVKQIATAPMCALFTARTEFRAPWPPRSHTSQLMLDRLAPTDAESIVLRVAESKALPAEVLRQIVTRTDGVPLFLEELTKTMLESGLLQMREDRFELTGPLPPLAIPMTLQDSLMSRLDRLATVKVVAQVGAVLGREFSFALLEAVAQTEPAALERELARLVDAEIIHQRGVPPNASYVFKHALIQEAAYQSLLKSLRREFHRRAAEVLAERFAEIASSQPELIARHYTEAGLAEQAIPFWRSAGANAVQRSANAEALAHFERGIELVRSLPGTSAHARQEFELLIASGPVLQAVRGFAAPETGATYTRARALGEEIGDPTASFLALFGQWLVRWGQGDLRGAQEIGEELLDLAHRSQDRALLLQAHHALWPQNLAMGNLSAVRRYVEEGCALYDPDHRGPLEFPYGGHDAGICAQFFGSWALWALGYPDRARAMVDQALEWSDRLAHPFTMAVILYGAAGLHRFRRDEARARHLADSGVALSSQHGFPLFQGGARLERGWISSCCEGRDEGIREMRQGLSEWEAFGGFFRPMWRALIGEACLQRGRFEEAAAALAEAATLIGKNGERFYEAEVLRLGGELALARSAPDATAAEVAFLAAIEIARSQEARSWELRATTSLARLWQRQGRREEGRRILGEIYAWFTEGFETADLRDAHALLGEIA